MSALQKIYGHTNGTIEDFGPHMGTSISEVLWSPDGQGGYDFVAIPIVATARMMLAKVPQVILHPAVSDPKPAPPATLERTKHLKTLQRGQDAQTTPDGKIIKAAIPEPTMHAVAKTLHEHHGHAMFDPDT